MSVFFFGDEIAKDVVARELHERQARELVALALELQGEAERRLVVGDQIVDDGLVAAATDVESGRAGREQTTNLKGRSGRIRRRRGDDAERHLVLSGDEADAAVKADLIGDGRGARVVHPGRKRARADREVVRAAELGSAEVAGVDRLQTRCGGRRIHQAGRRLKRDGDRGAAVVGHALDLEAEHLVDGLWAAGQRVVPEHVGEEPDRHDDVVAVTGMNDVLVDERGDPDGPPARRSGRPLAGAGELRPCKRHRPHEDRRADPLYPSHHMFLLVDSGGPGWRWDPSTTRLSDRPFLGRRPSSRSGPAMPTPNASLYWLVAIRASRATARDSFDREWLSLTPSRSAISLCGSSST